MSRARYPIENHARNADILAIACAACRHRGGGFGLARDVEYQHYRPPEQCREVGGRTTRRLAGVGHTVEQPHDTFDHGHVGAASVARDEIRERPFGHCPGVEIVAWPPCRHGMKGWIDVVRATLERLHGKASAAKCAHQAQRNRGLAGARARCRHDQAARAGELHHCQPTIDDSRPCLRPAILPITTMAGAPMPSRVASSASLARLLSTTSSPVVLAP